MKGTKRNEPVVGQVYRHGTGRQVEVVAITDEKPRTVVVKNLETGRKTHVNYASFCFDQPARGYTLVPARKGVSHAR